MVQGIELNTITGEFFHPEITTDQELLAHTTRTDNPHQVTAAQVGALSTSLLGQPNGIATLDGNGTVPFSQLPTSLAGGLSFQGTWDASSGLDPSATPGSGQYWVVDVAGSTDLDGITDWDIGDWALYDGIGTTWVKIDQSNAVVSVNGQTGVIVLDADDVGAIDSSLIGAANGVAPLNGSSLIDLVYLPVLDEDDMVSDSDQHLATQQSIKAYVSSVSGTIATNSDVDIGTEEIDSFSTALGRSVFWDVAIYNGLNGRSGRVLAAWNANNEVSFTETGNIDLGTTTDITISVDIDSGNVRLLATSLSNDWIIVASRKIL